MRTLVLDPRSGGSAADLYLLDEGRIRRRIALGYVPEIHYDRAERELVAVETELREDAGEPARYWLRRYRPDDLTLLGQTRIPERPMYAGFPGRSTSLAASPAGRFLYVLENRLTLRHPSAEDVLGVAILRYDRRGDVLERGAAVIESCTVAFGHTGDADETLYAHLSCDHPSTVVFARFHSPDLEWVRIEDLPPRAHSERETNGSWADPGDGTLYCVSGGGAVSVVRRRPPGARRLLALPLAEGQSVALHQIYGGGGRLFVGVSRSPGEQGLGLASEIWEISIAEAGVRRVTPLPMPVMNFVTTADGRILAAVSPYDRTAFWMETGSGRVISSVEDFGVSPAEVQLLS